MKRYFVFFIAEINWYKNNNIMKKNEWLVLKVQKQENDMLYERT